MSIIYDALTKIQQKHMNRINENTGHPIFAQKKSRSKLPLLVAAFITVSVLVSYQQFKGFSHAKAFLPGKKLVLNGIFLSDDMKVAMINNQSVQVGESVGDMRLVSIEAESVKLQNDSGLTELHVTT